MNLFLEILGKMYCIADQDKSPNLKRGLYHMTGCFLNKLFHETLYLLQKFRVGPLLNCCKTFWKKSSTYLRISALAAVCTNILH